jgi:hypothetical protein
MLMGCCLTCVAAYQTHERMHKGQGTSVALVLMVAGCQQRWSVGIAIWCHKTMDGCCQSAP